MPRKTTTTTTTTTVTREIYPIGKGRTATYCTFCKYTIPSATEHYHVANIGPMCDSCHALSLIVADGYGRNFVELTYTINASRAFRII